MRVLRAVPVPAILAPTALGGERMDEQMEYGFTRAVFVLDHVAEKHTAVEAEREFTEVTKENFWRMWPDIREWAEALWTAIDEERGQMARPVEDDELDETGGSG